MDVIEGGAIFLCKRGQKPHAINVMIIAGGVGAFELPGREVSRAEMQAVIDGDKANGFTVGYSTLEDIEIVTSFLPSWNREVVIEALDDAMRMMIDAHERGQL